MSCANNEKHEMTHDGRKRTAKPRKNQNTWSKGNLEILRSIGSGHHQTSGDMKKLQKNISGE